ncbi:hypothetical protein ACLB2K_010790 [Fragaria x ananassa]
MRGSSDETSARSSLIGSSPLRTALLACIILSCALHVVDASSGPTNWAELETKARMMKNECLGQTYDPGEDPMKVRVKKCLWVEIDFFSRVFNPRRVAQVLPTHPSEEAHNPRIPRQRIPQEAPPPPPPPSPPHRPPPPPRRHNNRPNNDHANLNEVFQYLVVIRSQQEAHGRMLDSIQREIQTIHRL